MTSSRIDGARIVDVTFDPYLGYHKKSSEAVQSNAYHKSWLLVIPDALHVQAILPESGTAAKLKPCKLGHHAQSLQQTDTIA